MWVIQLWASIEHCHLTLVDESGNIILNDYGAIPYKDTTFDQYEVLEHHEDPDNSENYIAVVTTI